MTVPVAVAPSCTVAGNVIDKVRVSLSRMVARAVAGSMLGSLAVTSTSMFPSIALLSFACTVKTACVAPGGIMTL